MLRVDRGCEAMVDRDTSAEQPPKGDVVDLEVVRRRELRRRQTASGHVPETPDEFRRRMIQNVAAAAVVLALVVGGAYLIVYLRNAMKLEACLESGRKNCVRVDTKATTDR